MGIGQSYLQGRSALLGWLTVTVLWLAIGFDLFAQDPQPSSDRLISAWAPRVELEAVGLRPYADLTTEVWGNVAGGLKAGAWWNQLLNFGFGLDTSKLGARSGGSFLAQFHWVANSERNTSFADYTGAINPVSGVMAADHFRIYNLYYRQSWRDGTFVLKAGQIAADDDFMSSGYTGVFANSAFGALPSQIGNRLGSCCGFSPAFPVYPVAAPGVFLRVEARPVLYFQSGLYYGRPGVDRPSNYGFDWASLSPPEVGIFFEGGYSYHLGPRATTLESTPGTRAPQNKLSRISTQFRIWN